MDTMSLGKWISLLYRYGQIYVARELKQYKIGTGQFLFLVVLYKKDGLPQDQLARCLNIDKGTTARAISKLEEAGYVSRKQNQKDLRSNLVFLTQKAKDFQPRAYSIINRWSEVITHGMSPQEVDYALALLEKMAENATVYIDNKRP
ncbi:MarR family winged helix-turn-helix transcriptional regulator [Desulfofalx alkaliphila]|uniref:MarR family winged helix-turn-helix transcriptional regulator n=1 Tax=Desulfofalx alkaliphila TaxID=105483 RepID=UPI0004E16AD8|nr:MarR family transcriptional regulator [Desulfofalx alkaliphila]